MKKTDEALQNWRDQIDSLDTELLRLIARRMDKVKAIGLYKKDQHLQPLNSSRHQAVLKRWLKEAHALDVDLEFAAQLYELIHDYAIKLEADQ